MEKQKYIVIFQQIVTGTHGFEHAYSWDGEYFTDKKKAISHGFVTRESDDFNIGTVRKGRLSGFYWMDKSLADHPLKKIAEEIGLEIT